MKKTLLLAAIATVFNACTTDNVDLNEKHIETWELVRITGSQNQTSTTGNDMAFQEFYTIYEDSLFTKTRTTNTESWILTGTYNYMTYKNEKHIVFTYSELNPIIKNCSNNLKEVLKFSSKTESSNTSHMCNGPKLDYKKKEN